MYIIYYRIKNGYIYNAIENLLIQRQRRIMMFLMQQQLSTMYALEDNLIQSRLSIRKLDEFNSYLVLLNIQNKEPKNISVIAFSEKDE